MQQVRSCFLDIRACGMACLVHAAWNVLSMQLKSLFYRQACPQAQEDSLICSGPRICWALYGIGDKYM